MGRISHWREKKYDLLIIGGGINGTGLARDCALRGLKVALLERGDFGGATSNASSGMIHGGLRYISFDVGTTKHSCRDSGYIQKIAPHLLFRIPVLMPITPGDYAPLVFIDTFFDVYDRYAPLKGGKRHLSLSARETLAIEPGLTAEIKGSIVFDEWGIDAHRLCVINALSAAEAGADVASYVEVTGLLTQPPNPTAGMKPQKVSGVSARDLLSGESVELRGRLVINLTGPWAGDIAEWASLNVKIRPGKGVHIVLDRKVTEVGIVTKSIDRRNVFLLPCGNYSIIGTTDDDYYGSPDDLDATHDEVCYLFEAIRRIFPPIAEAKVVRAFAGVRPTLYEWGKLEDELVRVHEIFDHEERDGVQGIITMAGGKLATYRWMAEELSDLICKKLGVEAPCTTHERPLPGGEEKVQIEELSREYALPLLVVDALSRRHGSRSREILEICRRDRSARRLICRHEPVIEAELRYVIRKEWAFFPGDLIRRTHMALSACQGLDCLWAGCQLLADELGNSPEKTKELWRQTAQELWHWRRPVLSGDQLAAEPLLRWQIGAGND